MIHVSYLALPDHWSLHSVVFKKCAEHFPIPMKKGAHCVVMLVLPILFGSPPIPNQQIALNLEKLSIVSVDIPTSHWNVEASLLSIKTELYGGANRRFQFKPLIILMERYEQLTEVSCVEAINRGKAQPYCCFDNRGIIKYR